MRSIKFNPRDPGPAINEAAAVLKRGGLVAYPTESFYALGADALNPEAVAKVFMVKGRVAEKPLPVIIHDKSAIPEYVRDISLEGLLIIERLMPGPVTALFWAAEIFPKNLTADTGKVGIRVPAHEIAASLAGAFGSPVTATSANASGMPGLTDPEDVARLIGGGIDLLLDAGITPGPPPSTLLDATVSPPRLLREGRVDKYLIERVLGTIKP